jgi:hypothetical protein
MPRNLRVRYNRRTGVGRIVVHNTRPSVSRKDFLELIHQVICITQVINQDRALCRFCGKTNTFLSTHEDNCLLSKLEKIEVRLSKLSAK